MTEFFKTRDKRHEVGENAYDRGRRNRRTDRHYNIGNARLVGTYADDHKNNIRFHRHRVVEEERFLRENGVDPHRAGSAYEFDQIIAKMKVTM